MKIAIIGSGISGLAAAWLLHENGHDIRVYEQNNYIGGHSNTVQIDEHPPIDTGFIVYNDHTYPNLIALFDLLDVQSTPTDMSFGISVEEGRLEYSSKSLFGQKQNFFRLKFYRMLKDILRFYKESPGVLTQDTDITLGTYLKENGYSKSFIEDHILPMGAAIWSMSKEDMFDYPLKTFVQFFSNHGLLQVKDRPQWRTVKGGSREYVSKLTQGFQNRILLNTKVERLNRTDKYVTVNGESYDHVILATHSDQALNLLPAASDLEKSVLGHLPYSTNTAYLHTDKNLMPKRQSCWSAWNYLASENNQVSLSYWMNILQQDIGNEQNYFVTLNPSEPPATDTILYETTYHHPIFTKECVDAQARIKELQGYKNTWFCGAWCGYGFHEDGLTSGLHVAEKITGVTRPWGQVAEKSSAAIHTI